MITGKIYPDARRLVYQTLVCWWAQIKPRQNRTYCICTETRVKEFSECCLSFDGTIVTNASFVKNLGTTNRYLFKTNCFEIPKLNFFFFSSNFNAVFFAKWSSLWVIDGQIHFLFAIILKRGLKGTQIPIFRIFDIWKVYRNLPLWNRLAK